MKTGTYIIPLLLGSALAIGIAIGYKLSRVGSGMGSKPSFSTDTNLNKAKLNRLIDYIEYEYVDKINTDSIVDQTVNGILNKLDPHSTYIPKRQLQQVNESMNGKFVGVGISFYMYRDSLAIIKAMKNSDALKKGIRFGDRILTADNDTLFGKQLSSDNVKDKLRGEINSKVKLSVYRKTNDSIFTVDIERKNIALPSVDSYYKVNDTLGYIRINRFAETTVDEFNKALASLEKEHVNSLILDLRNNTGGYLNVGIDIADIFLHGGKMIVYTKNNRDEIDKTYATEGGKFEDKPIFVLVNEQTASASEIVAGALQDNDRGTIVGRRTFGKGLVQTEMPLPDGSVIRLTTARYYTPTGRSIQKPYEKGDKESYEGDLYNRYTHGEFWSADSIKVNDSLKFVTPKGKVVYGGGGIIPDVFVPMNEENSHWVGEILQSGLVNFFLFEYLDTHSEIKKPALADFINGYNPLDDMAKKFITFLERRNVFVDLNRYRDEVNQSLKAGLAEIWFDDNTAGKIRNQNDPFIERCLY